MYVYTLGMFLYATVLEMDCRNNKSPPVTELVNQASLLAQLVKNLPAM